MSVIQAAVHSSGVIVRTQGITPPVESGIQADGGTLVLDAKGSITFKVVTQSAGPADDRFGTSSG